MWRRWRRDRGEGKSPWVVLILAAVGCGGLMLVAMVGILAAMILPAIARAREEARRIRCRNNLNQVARGMATYLNEHGDNRFYPYPLGLGTKPDDFNGAEWIAALHWTGVSQDPSIFICPSSPDTNANGLDLGDERADPAAFGSQTVSYAGMHYRSVVDLTGRPQAIRDDFPPNEPMGCDDTQGSINHGERNNGGMAVLFFDSHVEFKTNTELDLERGVGDPRGLLRMLRN